MKTGIWQALSKVTLLASAATLTSVATANPATAATFGFQGDYNPSNWTLTNNNADGFVNTSNAPESIVIAGGNLGFGFGAGETAYTTSVTSGITEISFNWDYSTRDIDGPFWDPFGYSLNGLFIQLTNNSSPSFQSGFTSVAVNSGDDFGFVVQTRDNLLGRSSAEISNFQAVPEPLTMFATLTAGGMGLLLRRKSKLQ